jgi:hypothetical protein
MVSEIVPIPNFTSDWHRMQPVYYRNQWFSQEPNFGDKKVARGLPIQENFLLTA